MTILKTIYMTVMQAKLKTPAMYVLPIPIISIIDSYKANKKCTTTILKLNNKANTGSAKYRAAKSKQKRQKVEYGSVAYACNKNCLHILKRR